MTLLVGTPFPWNDLSRQCPAFEAFKGLTASSGAIIAADSRWTHRSGVSEDGAVKVFAVGRDAIAGYSGVAGLGERCIEAWSKGLRKTDSIESLYDLARGLLQQACSGDPDEVESLSILLSSSNHDGATWLARFDGIHDFLPQPISDMVVIGPDRAKDYFLQSLRSLTAYNVSRANNRPLPADIGSWASAISGLIWDCGELGIDDRVGGPVSCISTTHGKVQGQGTTKVWREGTRMVSREVGIGSDGKTVLTGWTRGLRIPDSTSDEAAT